MPASLSGSTCNSYSKWGDVKKKVHGLREAFGDLDKSPFRPRLFVVLDKVHQPGLSDELTRLGVIAQNIFIWPRNGIEFYYPASILARVFACSRDQLQNLNVNGDVVCLHGISKTKNDLVNEVLRHMDISTEIPEELNSRFLKPLADAIA